MAAGEVVLVSEPLACVSCAFGAIPAPEELAQAIRDTPYTPAQRAALLVLYSGQDEDGDEQAGGGATDGTTDGTADVRRVTEDELDEWRLFGIVGCNSFGEEFNDFASTAARAAAAGGASPGPAHAAHAAPTTDDSPSSSSGGSGGSDQRQPQQPQRQQAGHLGLWPSFSMLNHSDLPNAVNYVVADRMLVLASRSIPRGSEVMINYLGRGSLRPVEERQAALAEGYQFSCDCARCTAELLCGCAGTDGGGGGSGSGAGSFAEGVQALLGRCEERAQVLSGLNLPPTAADPAAESGNTGEASARASSNLEVLERLFVQARDDVRVLDELVGRQPLDAAAAAAAGANGGTGGGTAVRQWLRASGFDLLSQHVALAEALGRWEDAGAALEQQLGVCEAVAPSSDLHMYLQVKRLSLSQQAEGPDGATARVELQRCAGVLRGRYGQDCTDETVGRLLQGAVYGLSQVMV
ncbi:SET and MYND domain-containing protein 3 [Tetrabaena socialis]|uniref:SET and MYND domain-containing protein 3 n=1 Tax=Tetrabaena socialis TaxID=47790 RepID=A0A2J7ZX57_9CHLO|nr:SET and MYND domain-containing protein 3 [Tetrabaena socialis]|eukprot:PNH04860.1 SET and MYND domain-containing protein 3 [Tetrabaena socialis]